MKYKLLTLSFFSLLIFSVWGDLLDSSSSENEETVWMIEGLKEAQDFVKLLDQEKYAETWSKSASLFQNTIKQKD